MSDTPKTPHAAETETSPALPGPLRCFGGAIVAGIISFALYTMTTAIIQTFAAKGIHSDNFTTQRIASAVRTLVIGLSALGTGIFGLSAFGLFGLGIQVLIQRSKGEPAPKS